MPRLLLEMPPMSQCKTPVFGGTVTTRNAADVLPKNVCSLAVISPICHVIHHPVLLPKTKLADIDNQEYGSLETMI